MCTIFNFRRVEFPWTSFWSRCWRQIASDRTICKSHRLTMAAPTWRPLGDHLVTTWWYPKQIASNYCFAKVTSSEVFSWNLWPMCSRGPESLSSDCQCQLVSPVAPWIMAGCTDSQPSMFIPVRYNLLDARYKSDPGELSWFSALCGHLSLNSLTHSDCPCHHSCRCGCHHHDHYNRHQHHHCRRDDDLDKQDRYADVKQYRLSLTRWNIHHYPFFPK